MLGAIDLERGAKVSGSRFYFLTGVGAAARVRADQPGDGAGPRRRLHPGDRAVAGQAAGDGGHRLPRPGRRRRLPDRGPGPLPRRHVGGPDGGVPLRRDPRRRRRCRCATPRSARASARRPARTARTPGASSGCTGSTRSRCSSTRPSRSPYAEHQRLLEWEKEFLDKLELAYRVIDVAAGDLGLSAQRKFDCEAWIPTQGQLPRAHLDLQLHRVPDPPARHPRPLRRRRRSARSPRSTARCARSPARSSRSSRPTSRPTARSACRRRCSPTSAGCEVLKPVA